ncbi:acyl-CoA N-acyltransferase [Cladorrhinum sp. PSN259]|nr:acyl-CoA N-acyltransferase [Cladorrhinum sp. PSN259]
MSEESKQVDPAAEKQPAPAPSSDKKPTAAEAEQSESETEATQAGNDGTASSSKKKKKKSKSKKKGNFIKDLFTGQVEPGVTQAQAEAQLKEAINGLTNEQVQEFMSLNPALMNELAEKNAAGDASKIPNIVELFKRLTLQDIMTGLATTGKNRKDMGSYKFWSTQPVPQFDEDPKLLMEEGPLKIQKVEDIDPEPIPLALPQFRWVTMDLTNDAELAEVEKLLYGHYVEDDEAMFRFRYSSSLLRWSLLSPGWKKDWHVGIRSGDTLCAFISAVPTEMRVRDNIIQGSEVNFLCIHKKLRGKRLTPILIKEITRRINREGIWQAIYTGGIVLPRPVSTCRYYHRALDWTKLYEVGFSPCPSNSTPTFQARKYKLPDVTSTKGLREMEPKDIDAVKELNDQYSKRFDLTPVWNKEEYEHWLLHKDSNGSERVIWTYVVENSEGKITDFFSFYCLESSAIKSTKHKSVRAAYLFYYASDIALKDPSNRLDLKTRLNALMADGLILAKKEKFDVFNALSLMDNSLFLEQQKYGPGDGQLHYYLFNYKANPIHGGVNRKNQVEEGTSSGVAFVML